MLGITKKIFIVLLSSIVNASNHAKCVSLSNQKCMIQPTLISLHPNEYSQEFHYYPFSVKLEDTLEVVLLLMTYLIKYVFKIKQDLYLPIFNIITGINELKTLTKHILSECKCKFDGRSCNSDQW